MPTPPKTKPTRPLSGGAAVKSRVAAADSDDEDDGYGFIQLGFSGH